MKSDNLSLDIEQCLLNFIREKSRRKFFGDVTFKFQNGEIKNVIVNQSVNMTGFMVMTIDS